MLHSFEQGKAYKESSVSAYGQDTTDVSWLAQDLSVSVEAHF